MRLLWVVAAAVCLVGRQAAADSWDDKHRERMFHMVLRSCGVENWDDALDESNNLKKIGECVACYKDLPKDDPAAWVRQANDCAANFLPKHKAACSAELAQVSAENRREQGHLVGMCFMHTRLELVAERCLKLTKGKDVMNFVGDHTMCMMDTRTNVTSFVRATEEAESRHEEGHPALYYTTDEYKETQEYIRNKMLPGMYCDAANNDEGQQAACRKCFAAVEGEDEAALEAAIKCSQEFLLPYYEDCHEMLEKFEVGNTQADAMVRRCYLRGVYRYVVRMCNPRQPRINTKALVLNARCAYDMWGRLVAEKEPEMAERIVKTFMSDFASREHLM